MFYFYFIVCRVLLFSGVLNTKTMTTMGLVININSSRTQFETSVYRIVSNSI